MSSAASLWYVFGPQGETRQMTNSLGNLANAYSYTAYGAPVATSSPYRNAFRYGGQVGYYFDANAAAGMYLCTARWFAPNIGRWVSRDPIGYSGGANLYKYCSNHPIRALDPSGNEVIFIHGAFGDAGTWTKPEKDAWAKYLGQLGTQVYNWATPTSGVSKNDIASAEDGLQALIEAVRREKGDSEPIYLVGFSQGCTTKQFAKLGFKAPIVTRVNGIFEVVSYLVAEKH